MTVSLILNSLLNSRGFSDENLSLYRTLIGSGRPVALLLNRSIKTWAKLISAYPTCQPTIEPMVQNYTGSNIKTGAHDKKEAQPQYVCQKMSDEPKTRGNVAECLSFIFNHSSRLKVVGDQDLACIRRNRVDIQR